MLSPHAESDPNRRLDSSGLSAPLWTFLALYLVCLLLAVGRLPFWLDEILELQLSKGHSIAQIARLVTQNRGGAPFDYLLRAAVVNSLGFSRAAARCPSVLSSLVAAGLLGVQGRSMKLRFPYLPALVFCAIPIQLRYAVEARPYEPALGMMAFGTVAVLSLVDRPGFAHTAMLTAVAAIALLTQPFAIFPLAGYAVWAAVSGGRSRKTASVRIGLALLAAAILSLPWWIWSYQHVRAAGGDTARYVWDARSLAVLVRELTGGGYIGTALLAACVAVGIAANKKAASFWLCGVVSAIGFALAADATSQYFFSIRQVLFAIPGLCILAGSGLDALWRRRPVFGAGVGLLVFGWFLHADARFFLGSREDWGAAAAAVRQWASPGACVLFSPAESESLFTFFEPGLSNRGCGEKDPARVVAASSPYGPAPSLGMPAPGRFAKVFSKDFHGPRIAVYDRR